MSFDRVYRGFPEKERPVDVPQDGIMIHWLIQRTTPRVCIVLGREVGEAMRLSSATERFALLIGRDEDAGKAAIRRAPWVGPEPGDFQGFWHGRVFRVHLPSHTSLSHFVDCKRVIIPAAEIIISDSTLTFPIPGWSA